LIISTYALRRAPRIHPVLATTHHAPRVEIGSGIAESGGQGKHLVAAGEVNVDGQRENRKAAKIRAGQIVECRGVRIVALPAE